MDHQGEEPISPQSHGDAFSARTASEASELICEGEENPTELPNMKEVAHRSKHRQHRSGKKEKLKEVIEEQNLKQVETRQTVEVLMHQLQETQKEGKDLYHQVIVLKEREKQKAIEIHKWQTASDSFQKESMGLKRQLASLTVARTEETAGPSQADKEVMSQAVEQLQMRLADYESLIAEFADQANRTIVEEPDEADTLEPTNLSQSFGDAEALRLDKAQISMDEDSSPQRPSAVASEEVAAAVEAAALRAAEAEAAARQAEADARQVVEDAEARCASAESKATESAARCTQAEEQVAACALQCQEAESAKDAAQRATDAALERQHEAEGSTTALRQQLTVAERRQLEGVRQVEMMNTLFHGVHCDLKKHVGRSRTARREARRAQSEVVLKKALGQDGFAQPPVVQARRESACESYHIGDESDGRASPDSPSGRPSPDSHSSEEIMQLKELHSQAEQRAQEALLAREAATASLETLRLEREEARIQLDEARAEAARDAAAAQASLEAAEQAARQSAEVSIAEAVRAADAAKEENDTPEQSFGRGCQYLVLLTKWQLGGSLCFLFFSLIGTGSAMPLIDDETWQFVPTLFVVCVGIGISSCAFASLRFKAARQLTVMAAQVQEGSDGAFYQKKIKRLLDHQALLAHIGRIEQELIRQKSIMSCQQSSPVSVAKEDPPTTVAAVPLVSATQIGSGPKMAAPAAPSSQASTAPVPPSPAEPSKEAVSEPSMEARPEPPVRTSAEPASTAGETVAPNSS